MAQVIDWAQRQAGDALTYAIALVYDDEARERRHPDSGRGLVWLVGTDGSDNAIDVLEEDRQRRMLARRFDPLIVPAGPDPDGRPGGRTTVGRSSAGIDRSFRRVPFGRILAPRTGKLVGPARN